MLYMSRAGGSLKTQADLQRVSLQLLAGAASLKAWWDGANKDELHAMDASVAKRIADVLKLTVTMNCTAQAIGVVWFGRLGNRSTKHCLIFRARAEV